MTFGSSMWVVLAMTLPERDAHGDLWVVALIATCLWIACACLVVCLALSKRAAQRWGLAGAIAVTLAGALSAVLYVADDYVADERATVLLLAGGALGYWLIVGLRAHRARAVFHCRHGADEGVHAGAV